MIDSLEALNYGCLKGSGAGPLVLPMTGFQALIGPNDSGKSTLLRAIRTVAHLSCDQPFGGPDATGNWTPFDPGVGLPPWTQPIILRVTNRAGRYGVEFHDRSVSETFDKHEPTKTGGWLRIDTQPRKLHSGSRVRAEHAIEIRRMIIESVGAAALIRFDADALRRPSPLIPEAAAVRFFDDRGYGLPGIYQAILGRGDDAFRGISEALRERFPTVKLLRVPAVTEQSLVMEVELRDGTRVRAPQMSEGMLYYLAYAAIPYVERVDTLLVEEPENGLHPARIADVVGSLRAFHERSGTKVVIATQSPLVVNELKPDEVTLVTRAPDEGTRLTPIMETPNFAERSSVYALGELWLSYADGRVEEPLTGSTAE